MSLTNLVSVPWSYVYKKSFKRTEVLQSWCVREHESFVQRKIMKGFYSEGYLPLGTLMLKHLKVYMLLREMKGIGWFLRT